VRGFELFGEEVGFRGRAEELAMLDKAWSDLRSDGCSAVVSVSGKEGVGKTRLAYEFAERVAKDGSARVIRVSAAANSAYASNGLAGQILRARFGLPHASDPEQARGKLRGALGEMLSSRQLGDAVQLLGYLLGIPAGDVSERAKRLMWERGLASLVSLLKRDAKKSPHLIVVDGIGEADDRDVRLLSSLSSSLSRVSLMMLWVGRSESSFPVLSGGNQVHLELSPFNDEVAAELAVAMLSRMEEPPDELVQALVKRANGNPRMMEQVLRALVSKEIVDASEDLWVFRPDKLAKAGKPASARDAAQERVEALDSGLRDVLEKAATVGQTFWFSGVLSLLRVEREKDEAFWVDDRKRNRLNRVLLDLLGLDLVRQSPRSSVAGDQEYVFQNEHEVEYLIEGIPSETRARNHGLIAQWMRRSAQRADDVYEWHLASAKHESLAGRASFAARNLFAAAGEAHLRLRSEAARSHLLEAASMLREDEGSLRYDVHMLLGEVELAGGLPDAAVESYQSALHDSVVLDDKRLGARAYVGLGKAHGHRGEYGEAAEMMRRARGLFQEVDDGEGVALALDELGHAIWLRRGKDAYREALGCFMKALSIRRGQSDKALLAESLKNLARIHLGNGYAIHARKYAKEALNIHKDQGRQKDLVETMTLLGSTWFEVQDYRRGLDIWSRASVVAEETGDRGVLSLILGHMGEAYLKLEDYTTARVYLREAQQLARDVGDFGVVVDAMRNESLGLVMKGDIKGAIACVEEAVALAEENEVSFKRALCWATRAKVMGEALVAGVLQETAELHRKISKGFSEAEAGLTNMGTELSRGRVLEDYASYLVANGSDRADAVKKKAAEILNRRKEDAPEGLG